MLEYKIFLGYLAVVIAILSFAIYLVGILRGKTKPHAFTWLVWGILNVVAFAAVLAGGGEAGSWILGANALFCFIISAIGFSQKIVQYDLYDWLALAGAFIGIFLWWSTKNPLYAVILISFSDLAGLIPTFRKAYRAPFEENMASFITGILYYPPAILALQSLNLTTWLYPATIILSDTVLVILIFIRRKQLRPEF